MSWLMKYARRGGSGENVTAKGGIGGDQHISQYLPPGAVLTALGGSYQAMTVTAGAALVVRPTTVPLATLWNGEAGGGKSLVIERAFAFNLVSSGPDTKYGIWLCVHPVGLAAIVDTITTKNNQAGKAGYGGNARMALATAVVDDGWFPWIGGGETVTWPLPGSMVVAEVNGRIIIPPTASISITVVATSIVNTFTAGFHWHEVQIDLG